MMWRSWTHPRGLALLARVSLRLGDVAEARAALRRLLAEWRDADASEPLLAEARSLLEGVADGEPA